MTAPVPPAKPARAQPNRTTNRVGYRWDEGSRRYQDPSGRFVSRAQVRATLDSALDRAAEGMRQATEALREGVLTVDRLAAWEFDMRQRIKDVHLYSSAAARGGWDNMGPEQYGRVGGLLSRGPAAGGGRGQFQYLEGFVQDLASGKQKLDGSLTRRVSMYAQAGRATYEREAGLAAAEAGMDEERNVRHAADSCAGCIDATARGWVPVGSLPPVGSRDCLTACKCTLEYRAAPVP